MVTSTSLDNLVKRLNELFCQRDKQDRRYSQVWLSDVGFGGFYRIDKVIVNVKAEHDLQSCNAETKYVIEELFKELTTEEMALIWRVEVYNASEEFHCQSEEIMIFTTADTCP